MACGGCAVSGPLGSMFSKQDREQATAYADDDVSGSVAARKAVLTAAALPPDADLEFARMAIVDMLKRNSKDSSIPCENPGTGAHGTVTPIAAAYKREGATCRDFLASYVQRGAEAWLQGEACRENKGPWEVKSLRPWRRS
jgi:surface antigen